MFNKQTLEDDLIDIFSSMKTRAHEEGFNGDKYFAEELAKAVKTFGESGDVATSDGGTVSSGVFSGSGQGSLSLTASDMYNPIKTACNKMKQGQGDDDTLAQAIGDGILAMTSKANVVSTDVSGVTTSPQGSPVPPSSGKAKGTITCNNTSLIQGLKNTFSNMKTKAHDEGFDGDEYFASNLADLAYDYFTAGTIATHGEGALSGTTGTGSIS